MKPLTFLLILIDFLKSNILRCCVDDSGTSVHHLSVLQDNNSLKVISFSCARGAAAVTTTTTTTIFVVSTASSSSEYLKRMQQV
jgi:hypothetical protein